MGLLFRFYRSELHPRWLLTSSSKPRAVAGLTRAVSHLDRAYINNSWPASLVFGLEPSHSWEANSAGARRAAGCPLFGFHRLSCATPFVLPTSRRSITSMRRCGASCWKSARRGEKHITNGTLTSEEESGSSRLAQPMCSPCGKQGAKRNKSRLRQFLEVIHRKNDSSEGQFRRYKCSSMTATFLSSRHTKEAGRRTRQFCACTYCPIWDGYVSMR